MKTRPIETGEARLRYSSRGDGARDVSGCGSAFARIGGIGLCCDIVLAMRWIFRRGAALLVFVSVLLVCTGATIAEGKDIRILQKALGNALGAKTNVGTRRLATLRQEVKEGQKTLVIGVIANDNPTPAGLRHGVFTDVARILGVLKSWDWPSKIDRAMIGEYYAKPNGSNFEVRPLLVCVVSAETIQRIDWNSLEPRRIPEVADVVKMDEAIK